MPGTPPLVVAARLNRVFEVLHRRDREPTTNAEVAAAVSAGRGSDPDHRIPPVALTADEVAALRAGTPVAGAAGKVSAIAAYFGVASPDFFWAGEEAELVRNVAEQLRLLELLRDNPGLSLGCTRGADPASLRPGELVTLFEYVLADARQQPPIGGGLVTGLPPKPETDGGRTSKDDARPAGAGGEVSRARRSWFGRRPAQRGPRG